MEQITQYCKSVLNNLDCYRKTIPLEIALGAAGVLIIILILVQSIRFVRKRKMTGGKEPGFKPAVAEEDSDVASEESYIEPEAVADQEFVTVKETKIPEPDRKIVEEPEPEPEPEGFFSRLKSGLSKTRNTFSTGLDRIFSGSRKIDDDLLEEIEELLITSDVGVQTTMSLMEKLVENTSDISNADSLKQKLRAEILSVIQKGQVRKEKKILAGPEVIMVVGVNGVGKTTTIGKLSARFKEQGKKVLIVAADTFRAAAGEQLAIWAEKSGAQIVRHRDGADPAAVAYDGLEAAIARGMDVVLVDTAGRLHTKVNLMEELKKIRRTIAKKLPDAPHEILMVLDATTGQNALTQAKLFHDAIGLTSIAMTKLDGTAKGGIVIGICDALQVPLDYIGVGEKIDDLQEFQPEQFVEALF